MKWLSVKEYADMVGLSTKSIYKACNQGRLKGARKVGRNWRIAPTDEAEIVTQDMGEMKDELICAINEAKQAALEIKTIIAGAASVLDSLKREMNL